MHDVMENVEELGREDHGGSPLVLPVSVTISILAVLVAVSTLLGHRANTEELLLQAQATDQWAFYQAKNIRLHEMQSVADMLTTLSPANKEQAATMKEKYLKQVEGYEGDKEDISEKAKEFEKERDVQSHRADRFEGGEVLLEIALVICSLMNRTCSRPPVVLAIVSTILGMVGSGRGSSFFSLGSLVSLATLLSAPADCSTVLHLRWQQVRPSPFPARPPSTHLPLCRLTAAASTMPRTSPP